MVLKVDIDSSQELTLVRSIAQSPRLAALIDESLEYHYVHDVQFDGAPCQPRGNVDQALGLFLALETYVRAHFWV